MSLPETPSIPIARPVIGDAEKAAVLEVLDSGQLAQGARVASLELAFQHLVDVRHAIATSSGTTALHISLLAHDIGPGDEVITSPFTFVASPNSILHAGAKPVFVDIDSETFNIDPAAVAAAITARTRALLVVHLYGHPCDMDRLVDLAAKHGLVLIEDCAQAIGASIRGRSVGSFGTSAFSLYATKNITSGEGGMIVTNDDRVAERARLLRNHGMRRRYEHEILGFNFRMMEIAAAIGLVQLSRLKDLNKRRCENAEYLTANLKTVSTPTVRDGYTHAWHQYTIRVPDRLDRDVAVARLNDAGVGTGIFYPKPAHQFEHLRRIVGRLSLPVSELLAGEVISLPVHPLVTKAELDHIVKQVNSL